MAILIVEQQRELEQRRERSLSLPALARRRSSMETLVLVLVQWRFEVTLIASALELAPP